MLSAFSITAFPFGNNKYLPVTPLSVVTIVFPDSNGVSLYFSDVIKSSSTHPPEGSVLVERKSGSPLTLPRYGWVAVTWVLTPSLITSLLKSPIICCAEP